MRLDRDEQNALLSVARDAIAAAIGVESRKRGPACFSGEQAEKQARPLFRNAGAFVSIHLAGDLRGCVGYPESELPLVDVVRRCAVGAATSDPRFPALTSEEWPLIAIEISVLGPIAPLADVSDLVVGRHGLIVQLGRRRGLLLPQVATEWGWDREQFASHTCRKAGLAPDAWRHGVELFTFEAQVFGDPAAP